MTYLLCYDVSDPRRLRRVARLLESYGMRVQKSFFQCRVPQQVLERLLERLLRVVDRRKDSVALYHLCEDCTRRAVTDGTGSLIRLESFSIL